MRKQFREELLEQVVENSCANKDVWVAVMMAEEHELLPIDRGASVRSAAIVGVAALAGSAGTPWPPGTEVSRGLGLSKQPDARGTCLARHCTMKPFVVLYATRQGHTRCIAEYLAMRIRDRGHAATVRDVRHLHEPFVLAGFAGAFVAASVHIGKHEREMVAFIKRHRGDLDALPTTFLSVSLTAAAAATGRAVDRAKASADSQRVIEELLSSTSWRPTHVMAVAGALPYSKYNFILRFVMKQIAKRQSLATDTSRDYEFTDWRALDDLVAGMIANTPGRTATTARAAHA
jgi:menaquinone-dependent protoporphyrinogen oxidase